MVAIRMAIRRLLLIAVPVLVAVVMIAAGGAALFLAPWEYDATFPEECREFMGEEPIGNDDDGWPVYKWQGDSAQMEACDAELGIESISIEVTDEDVPDWENGSAEYAFSIVSVEFSSEEWEDSWEWEEADGVLDQYEVIEIVRRGEEFDLWTSEECADFMVDVDVPTEAFPPELEGDPADYIFRGWIGTAEEYEACDPMS